MNRILKLMWLILAISILATSLIIPAAAYKYEVRDNGADQLEDIKTVLLHPTQQMQVMPVLGRIQLQLMEERVKSNMDMIHIF